MCVGAGGGEDLASWSMCTKAYIPLGKVCVCVWKCGRGYSSRSWSVCADVCAGFHVDVHVCNK